jgi:hypothetical protein
MAQATFENGNHTITVSVTGSREWAKGDNKRTYFDLAFDHKRTPISSLYEIIAGSTRDHTVIVGGRTFGYEYGIGSDSKTKRAAIDSAINSLAAQIAA